VDIKHGWGRKRKKRKKKLEQEEEVADGSIFNNKEEIATHAIYL
jgi:hypothetical protein